MSMEKRIPAKFRLGLILNRDFHEKNRWVSALTPRLVESLLQRFDCLWVQDQKDYEDNLGSVDALLSMEPGWAAPRLDFVRTPALKEKLAHTPSYIMYSDPHDNQWREDYFLQNGLAFILAYFYSPTLYHFRRAPAERILYFPWSIPDDWVSTEPITCRRQSRIALFGASQHEAYDVRNWCRTFHFVESLTNSGVENKVMSDAEYMKWLGTWDASIAAGSDDPRYRLTTPKYFEIPAAGSLLFAQETDDLERLGFRHMENCVLFNRSNFVQLAQQYLSKPADYAVIRESGRELILHRHRMSARMDFLENHIRQGLEGNIHRRKKALRGKKEVTAAAPRTGAVSSVSTSAQTQQAAAFLLPEEVYLASADRMDRVLSNLRELKSQQINQVDTYASVIGGLSGLNYLLAFDPRAIVFFDINPGMVAYARLIKAMIGLSETPEEFISRIFSRSVESYLARTGEEKLTCENQDDFLSMPVNETLLSDTLARLSPEERSTFEAFVAPHLPAGTLGGARNCRRLLPCWPIDERVPVGAGEALGTDEKGALVPNTNTFFYGHGWLASKEDYRKVRQALQDRPVRFMSFDLLRDDWHLLSSLGERLVLHISNVDDWFPEAWKERAQALDRHVVEAQGLCRVVTSHNGIRRPAADPHTYAYAALAPYVCGEVVEVTHKVPWGFHEIDRVNVSADDYLRRDYPSDTTILHILVGEGISRDSFEQVLRKALDRSERVIILEHNAASSDWTAEQSKRFIREEHLHETVKQCLHGSSFKLSRTLALAGERDLRRNLLVILDRNTAEDGKIDQPAARTGRNTIYARGGSPVEKARPRILLIADVPNWIFARHCRMFQRYLGSEFDFTIKVQGEPFREDDFDLIYPLEWNLVEAGQIGNPRKYITGIRSHIWWPDLNFANFTQFLATHFQRVHVVSKRLLDIFKPALPGVIYVTHGVDTELFTSSTRTDQSGKKLRLGWAGNRNQPAKGFKEFVEPLGEIPGVELVFCGYADRNLTMEEMRAFYDSLDAYICASGNNEGNNNSLLEAAAMKRAIITTDNGTVPEFLIDGKNALIVPREREAFVQAVEKLRDEPALRMKLGKAARRAVISAWDWKDRSEDYRVFFREALRTAQEAALQPIAQPAPVERAKAIQGASQKATPECSYEIIRKVIQAGMYPEAIRALQELIQSHPGFASAHHDLGILYHNSNEKEKALAHYEKAVSLDPEKPAFLQSLADFYVVEQNRTEDALRIYLGILKTDPSNIEVLSITGNLLAVNGNPDAARGYYLRILEMDPGNQNARDNLGFLASMEQGNGQLRGGETEHRQGAPSYDFRVVAIISTHNEGDVIYHVIGDLIQQGVSVYLLDHRSTDNTVEEAAKWLGKGLLHIEKFPDDSHYAEENKSQYIWRDILKRKSELASQLEADWFIHADADEFRESPWPGLTLKEAIQVVDRLGYNAIDFELLNFRPVDNSFVPGKDVREFLKYYEGAEDYNSRQVKAWKNHHLPIDLVTSGGHDVAFDGRTVFPIRFILRHYPIRSQQHGLLKVFHQRKNRFCAAERAMAWHVQYDLVRDESHNFIRQEEELRLYDSSSVRLKLLGNDPYSMLSMFQMASSANPSARAQIPCAERPENIPPSVQRHTEPLDKSAQESERRGERSRAVEAHDGILRLLISAGKHTEAIFALERLAGSFPDYAPAYNDLAVLCYETGCGEKALTHYEKAVSLDPGNATFRKNLADFHYVAMKRPEEAVRHYEKALLLDPRDMEILLILGNIRVESGDFRKAQECYLRVLEMDPSNELAGKTFDALDARGRECVEGDPENLLREARMLARRGLADRAIGKLETLLQVSPEHALAHNDLGFLHYRKGDTATACCHYEKAVALTPDDPTLLKNLADLYFVDAGRMEEALTIYHRILQGDPDDLDALKAIGSICVQRSLLEDASVFFERILNIDPQDEEARKTLESIRRIQYPGADAPLPCAKGRKESAGDLHREGGAPGAMETHNVKDRDHKKRASIIIPVFNKVDYTKKCVDTLRKNTPRDLYELIVVDNASSDGTAEYLKSLGDAVNVIANTENTGFVIACNQGAELARGEYLIFLNNDTEPTPGWLESLIEVADDNPRVGAVGAKLILPDGRLQEAGGIVFSDGNGWNFGYGDDPGKDIYNIACEVDYCSGACLLVRKSLFDELGGLDERYIPAYYEETDLCFGLRKMGYKVVYNPRAVVIHHESITAGRDTTSGFKKYIEINRRKFVDKWKEELIRHEAHPTQTGEQPVTASRTRLFQMPSDVSSRPIAPDAAERKVLFFFPQNPHPPRTGAHQRFLSMLRSFKELGFRVTVASTDLFAHFPWNPGSAEQLEKEYGIKVALYRGNGADRQYIDTVSRQNHGLINWKQYTPPGLVDYFRHLHSTLAPDIVMMNYAYWGALVSGDDFSGTRTLIDTHDLLTLGIKMKQALGNHLANPPFDAGKVPPELVREDFFRKFALDADDDEYDIYNRYDYTIAISPDEASKIQQKARSTRVIYIPMTFSVSPNHNTYDAPPVFAAGDNLFNIQGYLYLASRVLPAILEKEGRLTCDVLGDACKHFVEAPGTRLLGFVKDIKAHYAASKFAICPLIGGTGMQVKIPEAMAQGLPVITLKNVSKSSPVIHGVNGFIAESAHDFGEYMIELFNNRELCRKMGRQAAETIAEQFSERNTLETLSEITSARAPSSFRHETDIPGAAELTSDHESAPVVIGKPKTTIAVGLTEHFGDIVACEPVSRFLRENHPEAHIVWVVNERYRELVDTNPHIDETLAVRCLTEWITLADSGVFDKIIDLHVNGKSCPVCKVALQKSSGNTGITEKTYYSHGSLLQAFCKGAGLQELNDAPRVYIPASIKEKVDSLELPPRFITLHCLSNDPRRDWRDDKWDQLARSIRERFDLPVVEIGIRSVLSRHGQAGALNQCGRLSLLETAEVIKRSELFIGIDSGPAHLANAVGTPGIILLGHFVNFREYLPYTGHYAGGETVQILRNAKGPASEISVEKVLKAVGNRIRQKTIPSRHDWSARETAGRKGLGTTGGLSGNGAKLIAFYSPHFHPIIENDIWWGKSFTDWRPVTQTKPCFPGHYQPHLPSDFGFYDLQDRRLREEQARIARMHGIHGFCFWYYWFNGKMLLEGPLQDTLACGQPDIPFCLAWRNGDWTRRQYGLEPEILQEQTYGGEGEFETHFQWLLKAFRDRRYITIEGKPLLLISNPSEIPDIGSLTACWKKLAERNGFKGLFLMAVHDTAGVTDDHWRRLGFDGGLLYQPGFEFPRRYLEDQNRQWLNRILNGKERWGTAKQLVIPYYVAWPYMAEANSSTAQDPSLFSCVTPSWDDSPKRPAAGATILHHASPGSYESWLRMELQRVGNRTPDRRIVFINAWNSWADGCHLEPDLKFGRQFLQATRRALRDGLEEFPNPDWHLFKGVSAAPSCLDERFHHLVRSLQSSARERAILQHEIKQLTAQGHPGETTLKTEWLDVAKEKSAQIHLAMADCLQRRGTPDRAFSHLRIAAALQGECHPGTSAEAKEKPASPCDVVPSPCVQGNVSVILPLSDKLVYGKNCLRALLSYTGGNACEIIVINRTGQEETTLHLERLNRHIKVIAGKKDESVSESLNRAAEAAHGRYLVFLTEEAEVLPDWISPLVALVSDDARVGAVGPNLILPNGQVYSAGQIVLHDKRSKDPLTFRGIVSAQTLDGSEDGKPRIVQVLDSSCLLIRRTAFEDVGGFDRKFHIWGHHFDLLFKLQKRGWLAVCQPASTVFRFGSRFAPEQVQLAQADLHHMHAKWQAKIRPDFVAEQDGTVKKGEAGIIREYVSPQNRLPSGMPLKTGNMEDHVSIVILTFNELDYSKKCVESIRRHTPEPHEIIFVDNGSKDGTLQWLRELVRENTGYRLIENGKNLGFAKGCNQGVEAATGNYILLLNNDTVVTDRWLSGMLECLKSTPEAGIVGPMTNNISGVQKVGRVGYDAIEGLESYARSFREKNRHRRTEARRVVGFCMLFRRSLVDQIGLLDESFGTGNFEDDDFCARAALAGYRNVIAGDVFIHHFGSRSFIGNRIDYGSSLTGNRKIYNDKWRDIEQKPHEGRKIRALVARELAWKSSQQGNVKGAVDLYLSAIQQDPQDKRNYTELAQMLIQSGRHGDALDALRQCPIAAGDADRLVLEGQCREGLNELEEAGNLADLALSMNEVHAPALNLKGILAFRQNAAEEAREYFEKAAEADPSWGEPLTNLGVLLWTAGERDESIDLLEKGFILSPHVVDLTERYHAAAVSLGAHLRAEKVFREARDLCPSSRTIVFLLIDLLISQEDHGTAMQEIEAAMAAFETDDGFIAAALEVRGKIGPLEIEKKGYRDTLSLCMIVKNEQPNLVRCLSSVKAAVDEIIVVDTGSTDRTKDVAAVFGAKVFDFAWDEDFSHARNFSLSKAGGNWILVIDADETVSSRDHERLRSLIRKSPKGIGGYDLTTRNYVIEPNTSGWTANDGSYRDEEAGTGWYPNCKVRLFRRDPRIRFSGAVHELVEPSMLGAGMKIVACDVPVHHTGKLDRVRVTEKGERYFLLGMKKIEETGGTPRAILELAIQAGELGRYDDAIRLWRRYLDGKPAQDVSRAYVNLINACLNADRFDEALDEARKAKVHANGTRELLLNCAAAEFFAGDVRKAIKMTEKILNNEPDYPPALSLLAICYALAGHAGTSSEHLQRLHETGIEPRSQILPVIEKLRKVGKKDQANKLLILMDWQPRTDNGPSLPSPDRSRQGNGCSVQG